MVELKNQEIVFLRIPRVIFKAKIHNNHSVFSTINFIACEVPSLKGFPSLGCHF